MSGDTSPYAWQAEFASSARWIWSHVAWLKISCQWASFGEEAANRMLLDPDWNSATLCLRLNVLPTTCNELDSNESESAFLKQRHFLKSLAEMPSRRLKAIWESCRHCEKYSGGKWSSQSAPSTRRKAIVMKPTQSKLSLMLYTNATDGGWQQFDGADA